ncbi:hypothetical protein PHMEG_00010702 [Phytophthora megakarya]|uniref:Uncharacterized protein n=1 Tax=Phytophthora megakarya TaxID=4795 RepID=A0A225WD18_9STRA|nr:hypothetical protein PHMEG_00010702 [Phytophthora megakarya]
MIERATLKHHATPEGQNWSVKQSAPSICEALGIECPRCWAWQGKYPRKPPRGGCLGVKRITINGKSAFRNADVNGVLDIPFCPDTGSDVKMIDRPQPTVAIDTPLGIVAVGGSSVLCHGKLRVDIPIVTVAGPVHLSGIECLEFRHCGRLAGFLVGFAQLVQQHIETAEYETDGIPNDDMNMLGTSEDKVVDN